MAAHLVHPPPPLHPAHPHVRASTPTHTRPTPHHPIHHLPTHPRLSWDEAVALMPGQKDADQTTTTTKRPPCTRMRACTAAWRSPASPAASHCPRRYSQPGASSNRDWQLTVGGGWVSGRGQTNVDRSVLRRAAAGRWASTRCVLWPPQAGRPAGCGCDGHHPMGALPTNPHCLPRSSAPIAIDRQRACQRRRGLESHRAQGAGAKGAAAWDCPTALGGQQA